MFFIQSENAIRDHNTFIKPGWVFSCTVRQLYVLEYGLQTGSIGSCLVGFRRIAAGRIGTDFSFWVRSPRGSGDFLRIESVNVPCVRVKGPGEGSGSAGL